MNIFFKLVNVAQQNQLTKQIILTLHKNIC